MRSHFKLSMLVVLLMALFAFAQSQQVVNAASFSCDWINGRIYSGNTIYVPPGTGFEIGDTFTITHTGTAAQATVEIPDLIPFAFIPMGGSVTFTITTADTTLTMSNLTGSGDIEGTITCGDAPSASADDPSVEKLFTPGDGRINHHVADRAAPAAVYCQYQGVQVIRIDPVTSEGSDEIRLTAEEIEAAGVPSEGSVILAQTEWAIVARLADGRFSLNSWYADGKPYTIIWGECSLDSIEYVAR